MLIERKQLRFPSSLVQFLDELLEELNYVSFFPFMLSDLGVTEQEYRDPDFMFDGDQLLGLLRYLKFIRSDKLPVQRVLNYYSSTSTGVLALAGMSSATLKDAVAVAIRFSHIYMPALSIRFEEGGAESRMVVEVLSDFEEMTPAVVELLTIALKQMADEVIDDLPPCALHFSHPNWLGISEEEATRKYSAYSNCEIVFDSSFSGASGSNEFWQTPLRYSNPVTREMAVGILEKQVAEQLKPESFSDRVREILHSEATQDVYLSLNQVAERLHLTSRTLIRKLAKEELKFKGLVNEVRLNKAKQLLQDTKTPINLIALKVGYQDSSAFVRAFKNQLGKTPKQWRDSI